MPAKVIRTSDSMHGRWYQNLRVKLSSTGSMRRYCSIYEREHTQYGGAFEPAVPTMQNMHEWRHSKHMSDGFQGCKVCRLCWQRMKGSSTHRCWRHRPHAACQSPRAATRGTPQRPAQIPSSGGCIHTAPSHRQRLQLIVVASSLRDDTISIMATSLPVYQALATAVL